MKSGQAVTKKQKYIYLDQLLFLLPCLQNRQTEGNLEENDSQANDEDDDKSGPSTSTRIPPWKKRNRVPKRTDLYEALLKALNETNTIDEDTNFALFIVPSLKNLNSEEKLANIGILNIFKQIRLLPNLHIATMYIEGLTSGHHHNHYGLIHPPVCLWFRTFHHQAIPAKQPDLMFQVFQMTWNCTICKVLNFSCS